MDVNKIFAELGRMHLELMAVKEELAKAQAELATYKESKKAEVPPQG